VLLAFAIVSSVGFAVGCAADKEQTASRSSAADRSSSEAARVRTAVAQRQIPFVWSDGWLLMSVLLAGKEEPAALKDVFWTGDAINKAIFTFDELDGGIARLEAAGLITVSQGMFSPTSDALLLLASVEDLSLFDAMDALRASIGAPDPLDETNRDIRSAEWQSGKITQSEVASALAQYRREFQEELRELEERD
jgi:hypothetical protein